MQKMEKFSSALQLVALFIGGLWVCYRGTTFSDNSGHGSILPAAMAIVTGLTLIMIVIYGAAIMFFKGREEA